MNKLVIKDLKVSVDGKAILKGINLEINKGEIHALIGPNGHGKSTLLNTIMGHPSYTVDGGSITYNGEDLLACTVDQRSKKGIFFAMQHPMEISGVKNIDFLKGAINARRDTPISLYKFIREVEAASKEVGFDEQLIHRNLNEGFSGGEKKRNEILQMKLLHPSLALIDEIDSGLDVDGLNMVGEAINKANDGEFSALIISHYSKLYKDVKPTHVHIIIDGRIVKSGDYSLIERVDKEGYGWVERECNVSINKHDSKPKVSLGSCAIKEVISHGNN